VIFLRWGIFGILAVAGLLFVYNSSKSLAARHERVAAAASAAGAAPTATATADDAPRTPIVVACEVELTVAQRAIEAHRDAEPMDRVLRMREIAFEEDAERRRRLSGVAHRWFVYDLDIDAPALRRAVYSECEALKKP